MEGDTIRILNPNEHSLERPSWLACLAVVVAFYDPSLITNQIPADYPYDEVSARDRVPVVRAVHCSTRACCLYS